MEPHVEADPERILAATAASSAEQTADTAAFAPVHGYTTETLLKDKRFKVTAAERLSLTLRAAVVKQHANGLDLMPAACMPLLLS